MKKVLVFLSVVLLVFGALGSAGAMPISFDVAGSPDSSVTLSNVSTSGSTSVTASLVDDLDDVVFSLDDGEQYTFDFIKIEVGGLFGGGSADISATLAFDLPPDSVANGSGSGVWGTALGVISGGYLTWQNQPSPIVLADGSYFDVEFENILEGGLGNSTTVHATVTAHAAPVPEPATVLLMGIGLLGLGGYGRKRFKKN